MTATHSFDLQVWHTCQTNLKPEAYTLWSNFADREEGVSETVTRALAKASLFDGANLGAWLRTIMRNVRKDQYAKGYRKGTKPPTGDRLVYSGRYDYAAHCPDLCDPEGIMIAVEQWGSVAA